MRYLGGKTRIARHIAPLINERCGGGVPYWEPFVGGLNMIPHVRANRRVASDICRPLITMYRALQSGWVPPENVSEDEYRRAMSVRDLDDPVTAFAGFGCSFAGKWFGGYAKGAQVDGTPRNYAGGSRKVLLRDMALCDGVEFYCCGYHDGRVPSGWVIYCDPPYAGATGYDSAAEWDSVKFWEWSREVSKENVMLVSEYAAPDFMCKILEVDRNLETRGRSGAESRRRTERLFSAEPA